MMYLIYAVIVAAVVVVVAIKVFEAEVAEDLIAVMALRTATKARKM